MEASPKKMKKPPESVKPVVKMDEPEAGSNPKRLSVNGMKLPMKPPSDMFITIATHTISARSKRNVVITARSAPSSPMQIPFKNPPHREFPVRGINVL